MNILFNETFNIQRELMWSWEKKKKHLQQMLPAFSMFSNLDLNLYLIFLNVFHNFFFFFFADSISRVAEQVVEMSTNQVPKWLQNHYHL